MGKPVPTYEAKATTTKITATSRIAIKVRDNFYTIEYSEERAVQPVDGLDLEKERQSLFDDVNNIVDQQAEDIIRTFQKK